MLLENIIKNVLYEYIYPNKNFKSGKGDFQKAGKEGFRINGIETIKPNKDGQDEKNYSFKIGDENFDFNRMIRDIPGVKYPRQIKKIDNNINIDGIENDNVSNEIINSILFNSEKYDDRYLFSNGVARMLYDGEITNKDFGILSDICQYLSDFPHLLNKEFNSDNMYTFKNWENGISNFCNLSFKELKKLFGKDAKQYVKQQSNNVKPSSIISSNGYYVYHCYDFSSANGVSSFFKQNMCYLSSDSFFHEHMGDCGVLFMFKKIEETQVAPISEFFNDNKSFNELGIAVKLNEDGTIIIESITNGNNQSLYNINDDVKHSKHFTNKDLIDISNVIGDVNGFDVINYCINKTKERQGDRYDKILEKSKYKMYINKYYSNYINSNFSTEINNLIFYKMSNGVSVCIDKEKERVFLITEKGFITCNGKQVTEINKEIYHIINDVMSKYYDNWNGFKYNRRNKSIYIDEIKLNLILSKIIENICYQKAI